ncbi:hypothetical protein [Variovorax sp. V118]|uniref:hypothetical protein n=1 Tax=Variovorax sp. V118 TaxID=3065954 RepID=UPI0034E87A14
MSTIDLDAESRSTVNWRTWLRALHRIVCIAAASACACAQLSILVAAIEGGGRGNGGVGAPVVFSASLDVFCELGADCGGKLGGALSAPPFGIHSKSSSALSGSGVEFDESRGRPVVTEKLPAQPNTFAPRGIGQLQSHIRAAALVDSIAGDLAEPSQLRQNVLFR